MDVPSHDEGDAPPYYVSSSSSKSYALGGKIMLFSIILLFAIILLVLCLHVYARWHHLRRNRNRNRNRNSQSQHHHHHDPPERLGLDPFLLASIPVFVFPPPTRYSSPTDCAVCLCEFSAGQKCRTLPSCGHSFHVECIDMWFHSHTTCPLCRCPVELPTPPSKVLVLTVVPADAGGGVADHDQEEPKAPAVATVSGGCN